MKNMKSLICFVVITLTVVTQLLRPMAVYADGDTTPPPEDTSEVTTTPDPIETTVSVDETITVPTEAPDVTSTPVPTDPTADPEETATPTPQTDPAESSVETPIPVETVITPEESLPTEEEVVEPTLPEILDELPEGTEIVVLDENGDAEPLATEDAAETIAVGDPVWCPTGKEPGDPDCIGPFNSLQELVDSFVPTGNGTIWIEQGEDGSNSPVTIDGGTGGNWSSASLYDLTLQGGWDGNDGGTITDTNSVFNVPISILNWYGSLDINNITIQDTSNSSYSGLTVTSSNDVTIRDSTFLRNYVGAYIRTEGTVNITRSVFRENRWDGLQIFSDSGTPSTINLTDSQFYYNRRSGTDGYGAWLVTDAADSVYINHNSFINNWFGFVAYTPNVTIFPNNIFDLNCYDFYYDLYNYGVVQFGNWCGEPLPPPDTLPIFDLFVIRGDEFSLDCEAALGVYSKSLPNGDLVEIHCPVSGNGKIVRKDNVTLPAPLPQGYTYASAFEVEITKDDHLIQVINEGGFIKASFLASHLQQDKSYSVLYWDAWKFEDGSWVEKPEGGSWIQLKDFMVDGNAPRLFYLDEDASGFVPRKIVSGVNPVNRGGSARVEVSVNFPGIFVLAQN